MQLLVGFYIAAGRSVQRALETVAWLPLTMKGVFEARVHTQFDLFTRPFLAGRHTWVGHEINVN